MTGVILQARTGSLRLPGKTLLPLGGMPMLAYILRRLRAGLPDVFVVVATTVLPKDDALVALCKDEKVPCFRGSENDVLERYYQCAVHYGFSHIVRLTADNPFSDLDELERLMELHQHSGCDYTSSLAGLPVGTGAEVFTFSCLAMAHRDGHSLHHREHVNEYVLENSDIFSILELEVPLGKRHPELHLTVDTPDDYRQACQIVAAVEHHWVQAGDAVAWVLRSA